MDRSQERTMKKTRGRRSIPIQKIQKKSSRNVTFSKRREGLFKKAKEISTLCGSEIAVIVFSEAGRAFTSGSPCADCVIQRYLESSHSSNTLTAPRNFNNGGDLRWQNSIESLDSDQLKLYANYLRNMRDIIIARASSSANVVDQRDADLIIDDVQQGGELVDSPVQVVGDNQLMVLNTGCEMAVFDDVKQDEWVESSISFDGDSELISNLLTEYVLGDATPPTLYDMPWTWEEEDLSSLTALLQD